MNIDISKWLRIFDYKNIDSFLKSEKGKGTLQDSIIIVLVATFISRFPNSIISLLQMQSLQSINPINSIFTIVISFAISLIISPIFFLTMNYSQHLIASFLGGRGKFEDLAYLQALITGGFSILMIIFIIPSAIRLIPGTDVFVGAIFCLLFPILLVLAAYQLFVTYKNVLLVYGMDSGRAIAAVALNFVLWMIVIISIVFIAFMVLGPAYFGSMGAQGAF